MKQIEQLRAFDVMKERVLSREDDLERGRVIEGGRDQQPEIGEAIRVDEMGFVEQEQEGLLTESGSFEDAEEEALFASGRSLLTEGGEKDLEKRGALEIGEVDVDREELGGIELPGEEPQERGFAQACGRGDESEGPLVGEVVEFGQGVGETLVLEEMIQGRVFGEGMAVHVEVVSKHQDSFCCWR
jgi:hypothetical protein